MEKRISFREFQNAKIVAKTLEPHIAAINKLQAQIDGLDGELKEKATQMLTKLKETFDKKRESLKNQQQLEEQQIELYEAGILNATGFRVRDLVKRIIEPTGKTDANGKAIKVTKYLPTDIVSYDEVAKQYVVTVPDEEETETQEEAVVPPTTENQAGSDFDIDAEKNEADELPFSPEEEKEETIF